MVKQNVLNAGHFNWWPSASIHFWRRVSIGCVLHDKVSDEAREHTFKFHPKALRDLWRYMLWFSPREKVELALICPRAHRYESRTCLVVVQLSSRPMYPYLQHFWIIAAFDSNNNLTVMRLQSSMYLSVADAFILPPTEQASSTKTLSLTTTKHTCVSNWTAVIFFS